MYVEQIRLMAERLVETAKGAGVHVTISTRPLEPLAMRNYDLVVDAWPSRGGGPIEKPRDVQLIDAIGHALEDALAALDHQRQWITPPEIDGVVHAIYRAGLPIALRRAVAAKTEISPDLLAEIQAAPATSHGAVVDGQAVFINRGTSDAVYSAMAAHENCPTCAGSGHIEDVLAMTDATCLCCGCTDSHACEDGCSWLWVDRTRAIGVCSACMPPWIMAATQGKYAEVLGPFVVAMEQELHDYSHKGDRPGWLTMTRQGALREIDHHLEKLSNAVDAGDDALIREHTADVANMTMMLLGSCQQQIGLSHD